MKNINLYIASLASSLLLVSCDIEQLPQSDLTPETSFKTENELRLYVNGLMPMMTGVTSETADNGIQITLPTYMTGLRSSTIDAGNWSWINLRKINILFKYSGNCPDEKVRGKYEAMCHFLRAKFYYDKLKTFGDVPYYDKVLEDDDPDLYKARDPREYVAQHILEDLSDEVVAMLPTGKSLNTITQSTALALKSRFCLFEGTFRKYHGIEGGEYYLQQCVEASERLIGSGLYKIDKTGGPQVAYRDLFAQPLTGDASDVEVIMAQAYSFALGVKHGFNYNVQNPSGTRVGFEKRFVNSYLMADGSRFTDLPDYDKKTFVQEFANRDPRMKQTMRGPGFTRVGETTTDVGDLVKAISHSVTGYMPIKYFTDKVADAQNSNENDIVIYRYAEVLLNLAEAKAELGTLSQQDLDRTVKLIRERVDMPGLDMNTANTNPCTYLAAQYPLVSGSNKGVILEIRRERRIEMAMEGLRYDDIMRWKAGHLFVPQFLGVYFPGTGGVDLDGDGKNDIYLYTGSKPPTPLLKGAQPIKIGSEIFLSGETSGNLVVNTDKTKMWNEDRDYLAPIPLTSIVINPNLKQNPGWEKK